MLLRKLGMPGGVSEQQKQKKAKMSQQLGHSGSLIKELRFLKSQVPKPSSSYLLTKDKSILFCNIDKLQRRADNFADVSNCCASVGQSELETLPDVTAATASNRDYCPDAVLVITEEEIEEAIGQLRNSKLMVYQLRLKIFHWLTSLFYSIWISESVPSDWLNHLIIPLHKKGSRTECDNYRGIAPLSISSKVFYRVLLNRFRP